jgi:hypothetical protein
MDELNTDQVKKKQKPSRINKYGTVISPSRIRYSRVRGSLMGPDVVEEFIVDIPTVIPPPMMRRTLGIDLDSLGLDNPVCDIDYVNETDGSMVELLLRCGIRDYLYYIHIGDRYLFMYRDTSIKEPTYHFLNTVPFNTDKIETFTF